MNEYIEKAARAGYAIKAALYVVVGILAVREATRPGGGSGDAEGTKDALGELNGVPYGQVLIALAAAGLFAYAAWRFYQAFLDPEGKGADVKGIVKRLGLFGSGAVYAGLGVYAVRSVIGGASASSGGSNGAEERTSWLMDLPGGRWLVAIAGGITVYVGCYHCYRGATAQFEEKLALGALSRKARRWVIHACRFGIVARAVVFCVMGAFILYAAWTSDPDQAAGFSEAFGSLREAAYGRLLFGVVALGVIAYGGYCGINARFRRFG